MKITTRAVLARVSERTDRASSWVRSLIERRGYKRAAVALAAKNARTIWERTAQHRNQKEESAIRNSMQHPLIFGGVHLVEVTGAARSYRAASG